MSATDHQRLSGVQYGTGPADLTFNGRYAAEKKLQNAPYTGGGGLSREAYRFARFWLWIKAIVWLSAHAIVTALIYSHIVFEQETSGDKILGIIIHSSIVAGLNAMLFLVRFSIDAARQILNDRQSKYLGRGEFLNQLKCFALYAALATIMRHGFEGAESRTVVNALISVYIFITSFRHAVKQVTGALMCMGEALDDDTKSS
jgi:hypothetical protein